MKTARMWAILVLALAGLARPAAGTTYYVDPNGSADFTTIQAAIDVSWDGDEIEVAPGAYNESIDFKGKAITLRSTDPNDPNVVDATVIDANGLGLSVVTCNSSEGPDTILAGFTITGGSATNGGGMYNVGSSPTVTKCIFSSNNATSGGGGMYTKEGSATIINCTFESNAAGGDGGGIAVDGYGVTTNPTVTNCLFIGNTAGDDGGGMVIGYDVPTVTNCTFSGNTAADNGGGIRNYNQDPIVTNCILWGNSPDEISNGGGGSSIVTYSDVQGGYSGTGNIDADPGFVNPGGGDLRLVSSASPCVDAGDNSVVTEPNDVAGNDRIVDGDGDGTATVDMGAYEAQFTVHNMTQDIWYFTIQLAIDGASDYDEIEVAPGTYNEAINFLGKAIKLYSSGGPEVTTIDGGGIAGAYHVVQCVSGEGANTILEGFTITGGNANGSYPDHRGGGMYNVNSSSPTVSNCIFTGNAASTDGGGMYNGNYSSPTVTNCSFSNNTANYGGGMYNYTSCYPTVTNCTFTGNSAGSGGGGMYNVNSSSPTVSNCVFSGNEAGYYGGGGMHNHTNCYPTVTNCTFTGNAATNFGGGMLNYDNSSPMVTNCAFSGNTSGNEGGGMHNSDSNLRVTDCTFTGNFASWGGGMYNGYLSSPTVSNCTFTGNAATNYGGGMCNWEISLGVTNCVFSGNSATEGGGMYNFDSNPTVTNCTFSGNTAGDDGGGMYNRNSSSPTVTNCTFSGNAATNYGGGMYNIDSDPNLTNCILWGDTPDEIVEVASSTTVNYSDVEGGWSGAGGNNIDADPCFVDADTNDFRLLYDSPCIDAGDNSVVTELNDVAGNDRIVDGDRDGTATVDMGAYEFQSIHNITQDTWHTSIQLAIDEANDYDDIEVGPGTSNEAIDFLGKAVRLYSSWGPEVTTIDGGGAYHVVQCVSGEDGNTILEGFTITGGDANGTYPDDSGGGMYCENSSPTVTNCTFSGNSATNSGGGMGNLDSSPTVSNCTFSGNSATNYGGGMLNADSSPTVSNCTFSGNTATEGGGMYNFFNSSPTVVNCILWDDTPDEIVEVGSSTTVNYSDVQGGTGESWFGTGCIDADPGFVNPGGGDLRLVSSASPCVDAGDNNSLPADTADLDGDGNTTEPIPFDLDGNERIVDGDLDGTATVDMGAYEFQTWLIYNITQDIWYGTIQGAIDDANDYDEIEVAPGTYNEAIDFLGKAIRLYSSGGSEVTTIDGTGHYQVVQCVSGEDANTILEGFTITGGSRGMFNDGSSPTVTNCTFYENWGYHGGGMYNRNSSSPTVTNCTFSGNSAQDGGGMGNRNSSSPTVSNCVFSGNSASDAGGGMYCDGSSPTVSNCTFSNNVATNYGGGIRSYAGDPNVTNCILWGDTAPSGPEISIDGGSPTVNYSDVQGGWGGAGGNNIDADPCFVDADANDFRLLYDSPCIDAGDNTYVTEPNDLAGNDRIVDGDCNGSDIVDMGAYEFTSAYYGDFDADCAVDFVDYAILSDYWLTGEPSVDIAPQPAGDGIVDERDLDILCENWLAGK